MTTDRRQRVLELYHQTLGTDTAGRDAFLLDACAGDDELHRQVRSLLAQDPPENFLGALPEDPARNLIGRQIGPYRVESQLGAGGMGEVYRARDTKLGRDVAIKILPRVVGADPDRRARFEREARLLATLNHPHIGAIYGLEELDGDAGARAGAGRGRDAGRAPGATGRCFRSTTRSAIAQSDRRGARGGAREGHRAPRSEAGATSRSRRTASSRSLTSAWRRRQVDVSGSDAVPTARRRTGVVSRDTPAYMSPEQAQGQKVDKRADIWAFGCVLFEMLAGRRAFAGETTAETLAAVLHHEPPWAALPSDTPAGARMVVTRCLEKDLKQRVRDIGDVRLALAGAFTPYAGAAVPRSTVAAAPPLRRRAVPVVAALVIGAVVTAIAIRLQESRPAPQVTRLSLEATGTTALHVNGVEQDLTITPDGSRVIYVGDGGRQIFVRALDNLEPQSLVTGAVLRSPFVSPDGRWVGFVEDFASLKKVPIAGGPAIAVALIDAIIRGAAWLPDNTIVFATNRNRRAAACVGRRWHADDADEARTMRAMSPPIAGPSSFRTAALSSTRRSPAPAGSPRRRSACSICKPTRPAISWTEPAMPCTCPADIWLTSQERRCGRCRSTWAGVRRSERLSRY